LQAIRDFAAAGGPIYAECGGLMYLGETLELEEANYRLCGVLPFSTRMPSPLKLAYVEIETTDGMFGAGRTTHGHLFHHSELTGKPTVERCYRLQTTRGDRCEEGYRAGNVLASYVHLHFASAPHLAKAFLDTCLGR
jgi:cobyrinic acid a,c-diamide synthase